MKNFSFVCLCLFIFSACNKRHDLQEPAQNQQQNIKAGSLKGQNHLTTGVEHYRLLVKFSADAIQDFEELTKPLFKESPAVKSALAGGLQNKIDAFHYKQAIPFFAREKNTMLRGSTPAMKAGRVNLYAFRGLAYVAEAEKMSGEQVLQLANEFEQFDIVEYAVVEPIVDIPPPVTPDLIINQGYRLLFAPNSADSRGINATAAWDIGIYGQGIRIADIEYNYNTQHEDLSSPRCKYIVGTATSSYVDHGTSVAGILVAGRNNFGVRGMVSDADSFLFVQETSLGRATGIAEGLLHLRAGDVFIYEMQTGGPNGEYVPADYNQAVWDITKTATDAGIIVVAAAGNGNQNLDDAAFAAYNARGDNGAIIVGAGSTNQQKASFSTYGSRVNLQAWGEWNIATTGGGNLYNGGPNATYTSSFSGTSSATPIVASAVVAVQSWHKINNSGAVLSPAAMRNLLIQTGTLQTGGGHIGPIPNIAAAIQELGGTTGVTFYQDINYGGTASPALAKGNYTLSQMQANGVPDNWASSLKIPSGWTVILYDQDNFSGTSWTLTANNSWLGGISPNANDKVSSVKIQ